MFHFLTKTVCKECMLINIGLVGLIDLVLYCGIEFVSRIMEIYWYCYQPLMFWYL